MFAQGSLSQIEPAVPRGSAKNSDTDDRPSFAATMWLHIWVDQPTSFADHARAQGSHRRFVRRASAFVMAL
jgi:hypothetical protein